MKYYFAPMEGITGYIYRNAYEKHFGNIDKYFMPFISPTVHKDFTGRELNDIIPEHNRFINAVPQILTNNYEYFINTVNELEKFGYNEVNLNLGCPSGTVVSKYKGAGFLSIPKELDQFLEQVFENTDIKISIKTRIGKDSPEEFYELINIYNRYPLEELIIHPRIQTDFYKNKPNMDIFKYGLKESKNPVCYNGDIFNKIQYNKLMGECPDIDRIMLGRGIIGNPALVTEIKNNTYAGKEKLKDFHDEVYYGYKKLFNGSKNSLFKMKEFWFYMIHLFSDSDKFAKRIRKTQKCEEYENIILDMFDTLDIDKSDFKGFSSKYMK